MKADALVRVLIRDRAKLLGYIWSIVRDHHLADDVLQEVTVLALERAEEINGDEHLLLWSRKAARFKSMEILRNKAYRMVSLDDDVLDSLEDAWANLASTSTSDETAHLRACIKQLTPRGKEIVQLRYNEGLTGIQVAEVVKMKVRSVYVSLARIHQALEKCIQERRLNAK